MILKKPPSYYEDLADLFLQEGRWLEAAREYRKAADASIGHMRSARYEQAARQCEHKHGSEVPVFSITAKNNDAVLFRTRPVEDKEKLRNMLTAFKVSLPLAEFFVVVKSPSSIRSVPAAEFLTNY